MKFHIVKVLKPYFILSIATLAIALLQYFIGIKYSWDSNWYLLFSDWIGHLNTFDRLAVFAPLYYWSLGLLKFLGFGTVSSVVFYWWVSYFCLSVIFFLIKRSILVSLLALVTILSNATTFELFRYVWTELGYSILLTTAVYALYQLLKENSDSQNKYKILFLLSIALLPIQRYIGAYLSIYLGLVYLFYTRINIQKRLLELVVATLPLVFVIIWNILLTGHISGDRDPATYSFMENLELARKAISHHFRPEWILLTIGIILSVWISWKRKKFDPLLLLLFVPFVQLFFQVLSSSIYLFDPIDPRFFIVTTSTIVLVLFLLFKNLFDNKKNLFSISIILFSVLLISLNFVHKKPVLNLEKQESFAKVRKFLSEIKGINTVGLFIAGTQHLGAELVLTSKIIPAQHCQDYKSVGNFRYWEITYIPNCKNLTGYIYVPIKRDDKSKPKVIILSKFLLQKNWEKLFPEYHITNLGLFYGLKKKE